ncbi:MAG: hypothetical protein KDB25_09630, partial [Leucobacter sp.]|nr:hypothetical protein [Leucobacter sp.]
FAAAAALIARAQGFASRVVLGFRLGGAGAGVDGVPACGGPVVCTGEHLAAWIEVRDASGVWVPLDVSPQTRLAPQALEQGEQSPPFPTVPEMRDAEQVDPPTGGGDPSDAAEPREDPVAQASLWSFLAAAGLSVAALALLALPFLFLPVAKRLRRRRRRSEPEPEVRALGAWQEVRDYAVDAGADLPRQAGCARAARELGSDAARWVAAQVEVAVFSPGGIDSRTADRVWEAADAENRVRRAELSRWRRVRAAYSLRSYGIGFAARSRSARESAAPRPKRGARRSVQTQGKART